MRLVEMITREYQVQSTEASHGCVTQDTRTHAAALASKPTIEWQALKSISSAWRYVLRFGVYICCMNTGDTWGCFTCTHHGYTCTQGYAWWHWTTATQNLQGIQLFSMMLLHLYLCAFFDVHTWVPPPPLYQLSSTHSLTHFPHTLPHTPSHTPSHSLTLPHTHFFPHPLFTHLTQGATLQCASPTPSHRPVNPQLAKILEQRRHLIEAQQYNAMVADVTALVCGGGRGVWAREGCVHGWVYVEGMFVCVQE